MTQLETTLPAGLVSVYDTDAYSDDDFRRDLDEVHVATAVERRWIAEAGLEPYPNDEAILDDAAAGRLVRVSHGVGYIARQFLTDWTPERSGPEHPFHYSPPYVTRQTFELMEDITSRWQGELGESRFLSVTSLVRSTPYQQRLGQQERKLTISQEGELSSHQVGIAFDIDACGIKEANDWGGIRSINPRAPGFNESLIRESRMVLQSILNSEMLAGNLNYVEELPGTQQHCFHIAVKPAPLR